MSSGPQAPVEHDDVQSLRTRVDQLHNQLSQHRIEIERIRAEESRLRALIESVGVIAWEADPVTWRITFVNDRAEVITGHPVEKWYEPNFWLDHIHPDDRQAAAATCRLATERGESHELQYRMICADGRIVWIRDIVTVVKDGNRPRALRGVMIDVTAPVANIQELKHRDQRLRLVTDQLPAVLWTTDTEGRFTSSTGGGLRQLGLKPDEVTGTTLEEFFGNADGAGDVIEHHRRATQGEHREYTLELSDHVYDCRVEPLRDVEGRVIGVVGVAFDVTAHRRIEKALRESEQRWQSVFRFAIDPIWDWDIQKDKTTFSPSWAALLGVSPEDLERGGLSWNDLVHEDDRPQVWALLESCLQGTLPEYEAEYRIRTRQGGWKWVRSRGRVISRDSSGRPIRMIGCAVDMTERIRLEEALRYRIAAESLLASISTTFLSLEPEELDVGIAQALAQIGEFMGVDRSYIFELSGDNELLSNTHEWCAPGITSQREALQGFPAADVPWWMDQMKNLESIFIPDVDRLPDEASTERTLLQDQNIRSLIAVPMSIRGRLRGFLGLDSVKDYKAWSDEDRSLLRALAHVFANAMERRHVEQTIREKERFLSTLISNLPGWVYRCRNDKNWTYEYGSDGIEEVTGYRAELLLSGELSFAELIHPDDREQVWHGVQASIARREPFQLVYRIKDARDRERWVWEQGQAVFGPNSDVESLEGFITDITERKRAEIELRQHERDLQSIVENTPDVISRFDLDLRHIFVNAVIGRLTGDQPGDLQDRTIDEFPWPQETRQKWRSALEEAISNRCEQVIECEIPGARGMVCLETKFMPEFAPGGEVESILAISRDMTERKRAEARIFKASETQRLLLRELDHRVRNNLASLAALIDITGRNATDVREFAASVRNRVQAMTAVHSLLSRGHWTSVTLLDLLQSLVPSDLYKKLTCHGPAVSVVATQCTALGMVLQELIANSLKYGALGSPGGRIEVQWSVEAGSTAEMNRLALSWRESGGPPIEFIGAPGLGTDLVVGLVRTELRGSASFSYPREGAAHAFLLELDRDDSPR